jgi:uncharacterized protein YdhG (YjbR/CyaY superfamily)
MSGKRPTTVAEYIQAAPLEGQPHLRKIRAILKKAAPKAEETIKWNAPFYIDPRFVYSFAAFKEHLVFVPTPPVLKEFAKELEGYKTTINYLKLRYDEPLPEALIRKMALYRVRHMGDRESFW